MPGGGALTVRELVNESGLDMRLVTGEIGIDKAIAGVHLSDVRDPTPWLVPSSVLLTTGPTFATEPAVGVRLVERLAGIECAALGIATGHHVEGIPTEMIERAAELKLPVIEIPYGVPLRTIVSYIYHALTSEDLHRLRRTVAVQNHLLELMAEEGQVGKLIESVSSLLEMPITLFDGRGNLMAQAGEAGGARLAERLWRSYLALGGTVGPLGVVEVGRDRFYFRVVEMFGRVERVLGAASPHGADTEFVEMSLAFLQRLLALDLVRERDALETARRARTRLLRDYLAGSESREDITLRMTEQGLDVMSPWRIIFCEVAAPRRGRGGARVRRRSPSETEDLLATTAESVFGERLVPFLSTSHESGLVALLSLADGDESTARDLLAAVHSCLQEAVSPSQVIVGCSAARVGWTSAKRALHEAQDAALLARRAVVSDCVVLFEDVSGRFLLLGTQSDDVLRALYERTIAPLVASDARQHTRLLETLTALLDNGFAAQATADVLCIHRNTLQKRLHRIEQLLDVDFNRLDDVVELYLGVRAAELLGRPGPARVGAR